MTGNFVILGSFGKPGLLSVPFKRDFHTCLLKHTETKPRTNSSHNLILPSFCNQLGNQPNLHVEQIFKSRMQNDVQLMSTNWFCLLLPLYLTEILLKDDKELYQNSI